jgi:hypothetical protein
MPRRNLKSGNPDQLFLNRIFREGRWDLWEKALAEVKIAMGPEPPKEDMSARMMHAKKIKEEARKRMGFVSSDHERTLDRAYRDECSRKAVEQGLPDYSKAGSCQSFDNALKLLPVRADPQAENEWILAHPAIARKSRLTDNTKPIVINGHDLLNADHGRCPSRAAANKLQYWANKPEKVFEALTSPVKKGGGDVGPDAEEVSDENLFEVERLLKEVKCA